MPSIRNFLLTTYKNPQFFQTQLHTDFINVTMQGDVCDEILTIGLKIEKNRIIELYFHGESLCMVMIVASELLLQAINGQSITKARMLVENFAAFLSQKPYNQAQLGKLDVFANLIHSNQLVCGFLPINILLKMLK